MPAAKFRIARIYDAASKQDGHRVLIDRLWPRGVKKAEANVDLWAKEWAPSTELRKWFGHDPERYTEFSKRYRKELSAQRAEVKKGLKDIKSRTVTLLTATKDLEHSHAEVLKRFLDSL